MSKKKQITVFLVFFAFFAFTLFLHFSFFSVNITYAGHTCDDDGDQVQSVRCAHGTDMYDALVDAPPGTTLSQLADTLADLDLDGYAAKSWSQENDADFDPQDPTVATARWEEDIYDTNACVYPNAFEGSNTLYTCSSERHCERTSGQCDQPGCDLWPKSPDTGRVPPGQVIVGTTNPPDRNIVQRGNICQAEAYLKNKTVATLTDAEVPQIGDIINGETVLAVSYNCKDFDASDIPVDNDLDGEANFGESTEVNNVITLDCPQEGGLVPCGRKTDDPFTTILDETDPCNFCHFIILFNNIVSWVIWRIIPILGLGLIILGGFLYATSRGSEGQLRKGRDLILWTLLGYALILVAWTVMNSLFTQLGVAKWTGIAGETGTVASLNGDIITVNSPDPKWENDEWVGFLVTITEPGSPAEGISRKITNNTNNTFTTEVWDPLGVAVPQTNNAFRIGGWWQFQCGE